MQENDLGEEEKNWRIFDFVLPCGFARTIARAAGQAGFE